MTRDEAIEILSRPRSMKNVPDDIMEAHEMAIKALEQQTCEDAVSREAVLDIFADNADAVRPYSKTWEEVKALPSVNPQPICEEREKGECPYYAG